MDQTKLNESFKDQPVYKEADYSLDNLAASLPAPVKKVMTTLEQAGYEAFLAGGCVRDALMGRPPHDFDIATSAAPAQVLSLFARTIPTGIAHGTITVLEENEPVEVTTFRTEGKYKDHRHPDQVEFVQNIEDDLSRRDFTINAMAWNPRRGLVDPFGGQEDLEAGIIRAVGDPQKRFEEDALRMFRAFRFAGRYGFAIDPETRKAIDKLTPTASLVSIERVRDEVEKIMKDSPQILDQMTLLLQPWIPQLEIMKNTPQNSIYHYTDVLHHTLDALSAMPHYDQATAWALLLHDIGKPVVKQTYGGHDHFKKHEVESAKIASQLVRTLKLPKKAGEEVVKLVAFHDTFYAPKLLNLWKLRVLHGWSDDEVQKLFDVQYGDIMAHVSHDRLKNLEEFRRFYEAEKNLHPLSLQQLKINGTDVLDHTSLKGKQIKQALDAVLKEVILRPELDNRPSQLDLLAREEKRLQNAPVSSQR